MLEFINEIRNTAYLLPFVQPFIIARFLLGFFIHEFVKLWPQETVHGTLTLFNFLNSRNLAVMKFLVLQGSWYEVRPHYTEVQLHFA